MTNRTKEQLKHHYETYQGTPEQIHKRSLRNQARRELEAEGVVHKGDGLDVDHKRPMRAGGGNARSNLRAISKHRNRSWEDGV